ncbi:conserved exported hypothetical protein [Vibrio owensii]|uniref:hypothetical protein n=1 Tax=Vibrio owensii TaxID=696485 RepID=UPI0028955F34|nr:conserved exported hypothetical protein [Vibrio owensii]CAH1550855.1 conserved exported hypothetical protein [Vibrio owensii]
MKLFNMYLLKRNSSLSVLTSVSLATLLTACNGGSEGGSDNPVITSPVDNTAIFSANIGNNAIVGERTSINVTGYVNTSDDSEFEITSVESLSGDACQIVSSGSTSFDVSSNETQDCLYQYRVSPMSSSAQSESYVRVASASTYASTSLPRITASTTENQEIIIDLETELGASMPDSSYELQEQMVVIGNGNATYLDSPRIQFTPTGKGQSEIFYSYESDSAIKQGTISVSVSELTENTPPTANAFAHQELIKLGESTTIDVASYVSDLDGDNVQLVSVEDFNSTIALLSPTDVTNTQFTFESTTPGAHDVAYTISDHMGGYTTSVARIEVEPDFSLIQDWEDIVTYDPVIDTEIRFFAPMTKVYADYVNASYTSTYTENGEYGLKDAEVVTQTLTQARQYCKVRGGRLPLQRELETLIANETSAFSNHNWPTSKKYWTADKVSELNAATVNLNEGSVGEAAATGARYTTCVDLSEGVKDFSVEATYVEGSGNEYQYDLQVLDPDGEGAPYADLTLISQANMGVFDNGESVKESLADASGGLTQKYFDTSFTNTVLQISTSSKEELYAFVPKLENSEINVTDPALWNTRQYQIDDRPIPEVSVAGEDGLPVLANKNNHINQVYHEGFIGESFIAMYRVKASSSISAGAASFTIQQIGSNPNDWTSTQIPKSDGIPQDNSTFGFDTHYYFNGYYLIENGIRNSSAFVSANVRGTDNYVWFDKRGELVEIYTATVPDRPDTPVGSFSIDDTVDFTQPYWLTFGGYNQAAANSNVVSLYFASY